MYKPNVEQTVQSFSLTGQKEYFLFATKLWNSSFFWFIKASHQDLKARTACKLSCPYYAHRMMWLRVQLKGAARELGCIVLGKFAWASTSTLLCARGRQDGVAPRAPCFLFSACIR